MLLEETIGFNVPMKWGTVRSTGSPVDPQNLIDNDRGVPPVCMGHALPVVPMGCSGSCMINVM